MDQSEYTSIYDLEDGHWWYQTTHRRVIRELELLPPAGLILDAGCGTGGLLERLQALDRVFGFDASPAAVRLASQRKGLAHRIVSAGIEAIPFQDGTFDAVTCIDVIYHRLVEDEMRALQEIHRVLRPEGHVILQVPAFECLRGGHDEAVHTRKRYTVKEMTSLLSRSGFFPLKTSYRYPWLFGPAFIIRRCSRGTARSDLRPMQPIWNRSVQFVSSFFEFIFPRAPVGTSLLAVARKEHS